MKRLLLVLCLLSLMLIAGCNLNKDGPLPVPLSSIDDTPCNKKIVGTQVPDDCNTCTCTEFDGKYGWACTEIGCGVFS